MAVKKGKKPAPARRRRSTRRGGGTFIGLLIGLVLGVVGIVGTGWYVQTRPSPFHMPQSLARLAQNQAPLPLPGKPGDQPIVMQDFDAYRMPSPGQSQTNTGRPVTPQQEDVAIAVPVETPSLSPLPGSPSGVATAPVSSGSRLYLQAGSFENLAEADNVKALLALNGIQATVQRALLGDGRVVHRVRIGPFDSQEEMMSMRSQLTAAGLTAIPASQPM